MNSFWAPATAQLCTDRFQRHETDIFRVIRTGVKRRLENLASDWTRRLMPEFERFDRALGTQVLKIGNGFGSYVAIWKLSLNNASVDLNELGSKLTSYLGNDGVVSVRLNALNHATTDRHSEEKTMRGGTEGGFDYLLCAEVMNEDQVTLCEQRLTAALPKLFPRLSGFDSSCRRMFYGEAAHEGPT